MAVYAVVPVVAWLNKDEELLCCVIPSGILEILKQRRNFNK